jgi:hypothetical protein
VLPSIAGASSCIDVHSFLIIIIIIIPCKPYLLASATAPHPLGRRKVERLFSLFSVDHPDPYTPTRQHVGITPYGGLHT